MIDKGWQPQHCHHDRLWGCHTSSNPLRGSDFRNHQGVRNDHKGESFFDYCFCSVWFGKIRCDFQEQLLLLRSNNYAEQTWPIPRPRTCSCVFSGNMCSPLHSSAFNRLCGTSKYRLGLEGPSVGLGQSMFCLLEVYFTSVVCPLLKRARAPMRPQGVSPSQPDSSGVHHYTPVLLIHTLIWLYL